MTNSLFKPLIDRWPTAVTFADEVGAPIKNVREWLRTDSIPAPWFAAVVRAALARGFIDINADHLAIIAERRRLARMGVKAEAHSKAA